MVSKLLLLLFCFIKYSETSPRSVMGKRGENATLSCEFEDRDISDIVLSRFSKNILACEKGKCKSKNGRVFKEGSCDVFIKDLIFSDAGKYILRIHSQTEVERKYQLHIHDEISVKKGEKVKLDVLLSNAYKVERNSSGEWKEVWTRGHGVNSDRLSDRDGNLTINEFTANDTGTYRVLDYEGETLITVSVTESGTRSPRTAENTGHNLRFWTVSVGLPVLLAFCWL